MAMSRSESRRPAGSPTLRKQTSAKNAELSDELLTAVESRLHDKVRKIIITTPDELTDAILSPSMVTEHDFRTPLMAAAATGHFGLFTTVAHAVSRRIERRGHQPGLDKGKLWELQIRAKDRWGMTLAMIAASSGNVPILGAVLERIRTAKDPGRLLDADYSGKTVLMHATGAQRSAVFARFFKTIQDTFSYEEVEEQVLATSGDNRTILMHAAKCGDQLCMLAVANACRKAINPAKARMLITETDGDGMTFLMHAASGRKSGRIDLTFSDAVSQTRNQQRQRRQQQEEDQQYLPAPFTVDNAPSRFAGAASSLRHLQGTQAGLADRSVNYEFRPGDSKSPGRATPGAAAQTMQAEQAAQETQAETSSNSSSDDNFERLDAVTPLRESATAARMPQREGDESAVPFLHGDTGLMNPALILFKTAWSLVKDMLWKEEIREQLKAKDSWGRTILTHAVLSGQPLVFDAAFYGIREYILDYETDQLLGIQQDDNHETVMEVALAAASKEMNALVTRRDYELKKSVALQERASTIQAKIQAFIPGKLIVIFQLLLPEMGDRSRNSFILLLVMSLIAPVLASASSLVARETPSSKDDPRRSKMSLLLSAPAMFFWGIGTSDVGQLTLGWSESSSAASLAVATIVIPGLDAFFGSRSVIQWYDRWSCQRWWFEDAATKRWKKERAKSITNAELRAQKKANEGRANGQTKPKAASVSLPAQQQDVEAAGSEAPATSGREGDDSRGGGTAETKQSVDV